MNFSLAQFSPSLISSSSYCQAQLSPSCSPSCHYNYHYHHFYHYHYHRYPTIILRISGLASYSRRESNASRRKCILKSQKRNPKSPPSSLSSSAPPSLPLLLPLQSSSSTSSSSSSSQGGSGTRGTTGMLKSEFPTGCQKKMHTENQNKWGQSFPKPGIHNTTNGKKLSKEF